MTGVRLRIALIACLAFLCSSYLALAQQPEQEGPPIRITAPIDERRVITLSGNTHPLARRRKRTAIVPDATPVRRMLLLLSRSPEQDAALKQLLDDQQTPSSPRFRQWLTPAQFGRQFGPSDADLQTVTSWLASHGFQVDRVSAAKNVIEFSGNAGQLRQAFHTQIQQYEIGGKSHFANGNDPQIPAALAPVVKGIASLNNFGRKTFSHRLGGFTRDALSGEIKPDFTVYGPNNIPYYAIGPADFATIYNTAPLQQGGINGSGQTIAVIGLSNINLQDVNDFRSLFGLGPANTSVVIDGPDPGIDPFSELEAVLDTEWANAAAPGANVMLVAAADTATTSGIDLAALHAVESNQAGVISVSFGDCEQNLGNTENQFYQDLWKQASAQGITVVVSTGDNGSAGCDDFNTALVATSGLAVNGIASTPFNVAAGGTDFNDAGSQTAYWNLRSNPTTLQSARSYIPEITWNTSCASSATAAGNTCPPVPNGGTPPPSLNILAGSGGPSTCSSSTGSGSSLVCTGTAKPAWQSGAGVPNDGVRDLPDISLYSAVNSNSKSFYVICMADAIPVGAQSCRDVGGGIYFLGVGGTSVAAPAFAGMVALAEQKTGTRLGNVNYLLYSLAGQDCSPLTAACPFHDIVGGNISVPCAGGSPDCSASTSGATGVLIDSTGAPAYAARAGYDLATGLGSVNGLLLVNEIDKTVSGYQPTSTSLTLNGATNILHVTHGDPISVAVAVSPMQATGQVSLLGAGSFDQGGLSGGMAAWTSRLFPGGHYFASAHYAGDGVHAASDSNGVEVFVLPEPSQTFVNLISFDLKGNLLSFTGNNLAYGSPYVLRMDVGEAAAAISSAQGISSNCSNHIASCPSGTLTLTANGAAQDAGSYRLNSRGFSEDDAIQLAPGTYTVVAAYPGDASYSASSATTTLTITKAPTTTTLSPPATSIQYVQYGQFLNLGATVLSQSNGAPMSNTITISVDGQPLPANGQFSSLNPAPPYRYLNYSTLGLLVGGTHQVVASFPGDANYAASSSAPVTVTVTSVATTGGLSASPNPGLPRSPVTLTYAIYANFNTLGLPGPTGSVTFYDSGVAIGTVPVSATAGPLASATLSYTFTQLGTHNITAFYTGDTNFQGSSVGTPMQLTIVDQITTYGGGSLMVTPNPSATSLPTQLQATFLSQVSNTPAITGTVMFTDNGKPIAGTVTYSAPVNGYPAYIANLNYTFPTTGSHILAAAYSGDVNYIASVTTPVTVNVDSKLQTSVFYVNSNFAPAVLNVPVPITATAGATGIPIVYPPVYTGPAMTGTMTFYDNGTPITGQVTYNTVPSQNFSGTVAFVPTSTGTHNITAQYNGDSVFAGSQSSAFALPVVSSLPTQVGVNIFPNNFAVVGQQLSLTVNVSSAPYVGGPLMSGTVTVLDGGTALNVPFTYTYFNGSLTASGPYTFTTTGTHNLTVQYAGDSVYQASTSSTFTVTVQGALAINLFSSQGTFSSFGGTAVVNFNLVNNTQSFITVSVTCVADSAAASCTVPLPQVAVYANSVQAAVVDIRVPALSGAMRHQRRLWGDTAGFLVCGVLMGAGLFGRRRKTFALLLMLMILISLVSCGGGGGSTPGSSSGSTPSGSNPATPQSYHFTITAISGANTVTQVYTATVQ